MKKIGVIFILSLLVGCSTLKLNKECFIYSPLFSNIVANSNYQIAVYINKKIYIKGNEDFELQLVSLDTKEQNNLKRIKKIDLYYFDKELNKHIRIFSKSDFSDNVEKKVFIRIESTIIERIILNEYSMYSNLELAVNINGSMQLIVKQKSKKSKK